jgi:transposase
VTDPISGKTREAWLFVATLGVSSYTFAWAAFSQDLPSWIEANVRALNFFGGVPEIIVPDNLKSGVKKPCRYEPDINPTYHEMARHYGPRRSTAVGTYWPLEWRKSLKSRGRVSGKLEKL